MRDQERRMWGENALAADPDLMFRDEVEEAIVKQLREDLRR